MDDCYDEEDRNADRKPPLDELSNPDQNPDDCIIDEDALKMFGDLEKILGDDPSQRMKKKVNLHPTLVTRWKDWIVTGLSNEVIDELTAKYPLTGNCNFEAPALNLEVMHSLKETAQKRDKHFVHTQNLAGTALSALGMALTSLLREEAVDKLKLLELLSDAAKLLIEVHHKESNARIAYILPGMGKQIKAVLEETKPDTFLFGHGLTEKLQEAIALEKLGKELKATQEPPAPKKPNPGRPKWKNPAHKHPGPGHVDHRSRPGYHRNNFQQKPRHSPYHTGPPKQQNQARPPNNRPEVHRRS